MNGTKTGQTEAKGREGCAVRTRQRMPLLFGMMLACVLVTGTLLTLEGRSYEAIPLHLCSVAALVAMAVALGARGTALDFLWYLGMPGALLALLFPAPAVCRRQTLFDLSYAATHALILIIPLRAMRMGSRPRRGRAFGMLLLLQGIALVAFVANRLLGTDFLFLSAPPAKTPLEIPFSLGMPAYLLTLEALMAAVCLTMQGILKRLEPKRQI